MDYSAKQISRIIIGIVTFLAIVYPSAAQDWSEKIQLYGHGFSVPNDYTDEEFEYIANTYKIFTVEKRSAYADYGGSPSTERATIGTAANLKAINPEIKVLLYWNSVMSYESIYEYNDIFAAHPEWVHSIWTVGSGAQYEIYDLENIDCQDWWVNSVVEIIRDGNLDGVFFDAGPKAEVSGLTDALCTAKDRVRDSIGEDKIIIYNGYRVADVNTLQAGPELIEHASGVFIEFFLNSPCDTKEEAALLYDNLIEAYEDGKMIVPRGKVSSSLPGAADPFLFSFASFLLFYGPNSYWIYNSGYNKTQGMFDYYPEYYDIATGQSLGSPQRDGWVYTREFENISVRVDLENLTASITPIDSLQFNVFDSSTDSLLSDVKIQFDEEEYQTDESGQISLTLLEGIYDFTFTKTAYDTLFQTVDLSSDSTINVYLNKESFDIVFQVNDYETGAMLQDVDISIEDSTYRTDEEGNSIMILEYGDHIYSCSKEGYIQLDDTISVTKDSTVTVLLSAITDVSLNKAFESISLHPNPVHDELIIEVESQMMSNYVIYNLQGQQILKGELKQRKNSIDVSSLISGQYLIKTFGSKSIIKKSFIKI